MLTAAVNLGASSPIDIQVQGKSLAVAQDLAREVLGGGVGLPAR